MKNSMNIYTDFSASISTIKEMVYSEINSYRNPIRDTALEILEKYKLTNENNSPKGIVFYLPLWLGTELKVDYFVRQQLSLANFFVTLCVDIKDEVKDKQVNDYKLILLSDRLLLSAINIFRSVVGNNESFWNHFNDCLDQNLSIRIDENSITKVETLLDNSIDSNKLISRYHRVCEGGAFLRPAAIACAMLSDKENQIQEISKAIDLYHIGLKIIDDYVDWEDDLEFNSQSLFLNCVREWIGQKQIEKLDVQKFILASDLTEKLITEAINCTESAKQLINKYDLNYFSCYLDKQLSIYIQLEEQLKASKAMIKTRILTDLNLD